jgi:hypothetical protein
VTIFGAAAPGIRTPPTEDVIQFAQAIQVQIDQRDLRAHAERDLCSVRAHDTPADDADVAWGYAWNTAQEDSAAAMLLLEIGCADLDAHAARDFAHGSQQRQGADAITYSFVGDACDFRR